MEQREVASNAVRHELERCNWHDLREDTYLTASIGKVGIAMVRTERDRLNGEYKVALDPADITRFYPDPSGSRLYDCEYVCYEPQLDMSKVRAICDAYGVPEKYKKIVPNASSSTGTMPTVSRSRTDDEIVYAPGSEIALSSKNEIRTRKANVAFIWIKDDALSVEVKSTVDSKPEADADLTCTTCGMVYESDETPTCPECGSAEATYAEQTNMYPFGRLIVLCQEQVLYDGQNPLEIDCVFPFAAYVHYRIPGEFWGFSDLDLLKSNQMQADKTVSQLIDAMRLTSMGYLQIPAGEPAWANVTNEPGQKVPTRPENKDTTRWITPQGYNPQLHSIADNTIYSDFQRISGETDMAVSQAPSAPDSATEVKSRDTTRNQRIGRHLDAMNQFSSDLASLVWQVMVQYYVGPRPFMFSPNGSQFESVVLDVSTLPRNLRIRVEADIDAIEKDKLAGQNLVMAMQSGVIPMMPDILLRALGTPEPIINEIMNRPEMQMHLMMMQNQAAAMAMGAPPPGQAAPQPSGGEQSGTS